MKTCEEKGLSENYEPETGTVATAAHSIFNQFDLLGKGLLLATGRCSICRAYVWVVRNSFSTVTLLKYGFFKKLFL